MCAHFHTRAAESLLYNNITVYIPKAGTDRYVVRHKKHATLKQLASRLTAKGFELVMKVESAPAELLTCSDEAQDIDEVELEDGMQLAVVVDAPFLPYDETSKRIAGLEKMVRAAASIPCMSDMLRASRGLQLPTLPLLCASCKWNYGSANEAVCGRACHWLRPQVGSHSSVVP